MLYYTHNVVSAVNLIEAMRKNNVKNVRFSLPADHTVWQAFYRTLSETAGRKQHAFSKSDMHITVIKQDTHLIAIGLGSHS